MTDRLRKVIDEWRLEQQGRHERIDQFAKIALGEAATGAPPLQDPELYFWPGLESQPFHDRAVSWMVELEAAYPVIRSELGGLLNAKVAFTPYAQGADARYRQGKVFFRRRFRPWFDCALLSPPPNSDCPETLSTLPPR